MARCTWSSTTSGLECMKRVEVGAEVEYDLGVGSNLRLHAFLYFVSAAPRCDTNTRRQALDAQARAGGAPASIGDVVGSAPESLSLRPARRLPHAESGLVRLLLLPSSASRLRRGSALADAPSSLFPFLQPRPACPIPAPPPLTHSLLHLRNVTCCRLSLIGPSHNHRQSSGRPLSPSSATHHRFPYLSNFAAQPIPLFTPWQPGLRVNDTLIPITTTVPPGNPAEGGKIIQSR